MTYCSYCNSTAGPATCPVHSRVNQPPQLNTIPSNVFVDVGALQRQLSDALLQLDELKKKLVVGGMPVPGLICVAEAPFVKSLQEFRDLELERDASNRLYDEAMKAIRLIAPYCKVKYGMDEEAVAAIEKLAEKRDAPVPIRKGCICGPEGMCDYHRVT